METESAQFSPSPDLQYVTCLCQCCLAHEFVRVMFVKHGDVLCYPSTPVVPD